MNLPRKFFSKRILALFSFAILLGLVLYFVLANKATAPSFLNPKIVEKENSAPFVFLVFGDSGTGSREQRILTSIMEKQKADLIIHTGDVAYQSGTYEEIQKNVLDIYSKLFAETPFYPSMGNHDYQTDKGTPYLNTFRPPDPGRYYSVVFENTLFISLDSNDSLNEEPSKMISWLEERLSRREEKIEWTVVYFHHPPYETGSVHKSDSRVQAKIVPLLEKYKVDLVFNGHEHSYQRSCSIQKSSCVDQGVVYIVTGGGGAPLYALGSPQWFTQKQVKTHHFVRTEVEGCKLKIKAIDTTEAVFDQTEFSKC